MLDLLTLVFFSVILLIPAIATSGRWYEFVSGFFIAIMGMIVVLGGLFQMTAIAAYTASLFR